MIELALQSTVVFALAAVANALLRRGSAAQRHSVWMLAFLAIPAMALLSRVAPPVPAAMALPTLAIRTASTPPVTIGNSIDIVTSVWAAVTLLLLIRLALSCAAIRNRPEAVASPFAYGVFRPGIYLPPSAAEWPDAKRNSVVLHERAHIRRHDPLAHLFSQVVCAVIWFQPLAWYAARRAAAEREQACDDLVVESGVAPSTYAGHLLEVAREYRHHPAVGIAMAARRSSLEVRLRAITDGKTQRAPLTARWRLAQCLALALVVSGVAAQTKDERIYSVKEQGVVAPKVIHRVEPEYTEDAKTNRIEGGVVLSFEIGTDGKTRNIAVVESLTKKLDESAVTAMKQWRFEPCKKDGQPVICSAHVRMEYRLL